MSVSEFLTNRFVLTLFVSFAFVNLVAAVDGCAHNNGGCSDVCINYDESYKVRCQCLDPATRLDPTNEKTCIGGCSLRYASAGILKRY